jgi:hypothetical protein
MSTPAGAGSGRSRWRRWAVPLVVMWAAVLVVAGGWAAHHGTATVREQSPLAAGQQTIDDAVDAVLAAAGPGARPLVGDPEITEGCRLTLARRGTSIDRTVLFTVPEGQEPAMVERLVDRLPEHWDVRYFRASSRLRADAGDFVVVTGEVAQPGQVRVTLGTGCRPG